MRVHAGNPDWREVPYTRDEEPNKILHRVCIFIYICIRYTVLLATLCEGWVLVNTEESNNKSTESSKTETELKAMRKRSKILKISGE